MRCPISWTLPLALLLACSEDPNVGLDAGLGDAGSDASTDGGDDGGLGADGGADIGLDDTGRADIGRRDSGPRVDAGPGDENLIGTSLEGIAVEWDWPVNLCNEWRENETLQHEREHKVHVRLPPHFRPSLGDGHMGAATLESGRVDQGPLFADQHDIAETDVQSSLMRYELRDPSGNTSLSASVEHVLENGAILIEEYSVYRERGDQRPVSFDGDGYEAGFGYVAPGRSYEDGVRLGLCGGPDELETDVEVLVGTNARGSATVLRRLRTQQAFAGSFPVHLEKTMFLFSDRPYQTFAAEGFWAHVYSAEHHNWFEDTEVDFTRDLRWHETVYEPYLRGAQPVPEMITRAQLLRLNGWDANPEIVIDWLDLSTGNPNEARYAVEDNGAWLRVGERTLLMGNHCSGAEVLTFVAYDWSWAVQVISCGTNPWVIESVVPVAFRPDASVVGVPIDGASLTPTIIDGQSGWRIPVGSHAIELAPWTSEPYYLVRVLDDQGQQIESSLSSPQSLEDVLDVGARDEEISGANATGDVLMKLVRRWAGQGVGESAIYAPVSFSLYFDGKTHQVDAWDRLDYTNTHHNWFDALVAETDELELHWSVDWAQGPLVHRVRVVRKSDQVELLPETEITVN